MVSQLSYIHNGNLYTGNKVYTQIPSYQYRNSNYKYSIYKDAILPVQNLPL